MEKWLQAKLPRMKVKTMLKNWPDEEITMTGIATPTPPCTGGNCCHCCHHWGMAATFKCHTLLQGSAPTKCQVSKKKKLVSSPCSLLNKRFVGIHLIEEDQVPCLIPGCKGDWNGGPNSFLGEMGLKILELTKI